MPHIGAPSGEHAGILCTESERGDGEVHNWVTEAMLLSPQKRRVQGWMVWPERTGHSGLAVRTQDKVWHSRDTGPALCNTPTPRKGLQLLPTTL